MRRNRQSQVSGRTTFGRCGQLETESGFKTTEKTHPHLLVYVRGTERIQKNFERLCLKHGCVSERVHIGVEFVVMSMEGKERIGQYDEGTIAYEVWGKFGALESVCAYQYCYASEFILSVRIPHQAIGTGKEKIFRKPLVKETALQDLFPESMNKGIPTNIPKKTGKKKRNYGDNAVMGEVKQMERFSIPMAQTELEGPIPEVKKEYAARPSYKLTAIEKSIRRHQSRHPEMYTGSPSIRAFQIREAQKSR